MPPNIEFSFLTAWHDVSAFDCFTGHEEDKDLNDFIKNDALAQKDEGWNATYVATEKGDKKVVGFFALSPDSISINAKKQGELGKEYRNIPAVKIGRFAVDKNFQGKGIGTEMLRYAIGHIIEKICPNLGGMYVTLDSYPHRAQWYKSNFGFKENTLIDNHSTRFVNLIYPIKEFKARQTMNDDAGTLNITT